MDLFKLHNNPDQETQVLEYQYLLLLSETLSQSPTMASSTARSFPTIKAVRSFVIDGVGSGGDYHNVKGGHW
jgi:hypothetical protein